MTLLQKLRALAAPEAKATPGPWEAREFSDPQWTVHAPGQTPAIVAQSVGGNDEANAALIAESRNLLKAALALVKAQHEALEASQKVLETVNAFIDDIGKSNPGWIGKLVLQRYDVMNEAYIGLERQPKKNSAALQLASQEQP